MATVFISPPFHTGRVFYIDKADVRVGLKCPALDGLVERLAQHCESVRYEQHKTKCTGRKRILITPYLHLSRPELEAFRILNELRQRNALPQIYEVMRIEMAQDILTPTWSAAEAVRDWVKQYQIELWRGGKITNQLTDKEDPRKKTDYSSIKRSCNETAMYILARSKKGRSPCCQIERRIGGKRAISGAKLLLANLATMSIEDVRNWWANGKACKCQVRKMNYERLLACWRGKKLPVGRPKMIRSSVSSGSDKPRGYHYDYVKRAAETIVRDAEYKYLREMAPNNKAISEDAVIGSRQLQRVVDALTHVHGLPKDAYLDHVRVP